MPEVTERSVVRGQVLANTSLEMACGPGDVTALAMSEATLALVQAIGEIAAHAVDPSAILRKAIELLERMRICGHHEHCPDCAARVAHEESVS